MRRPIAATAAEGAGARKCRGVVGEVHVAVRVGKLDEGELNQAELGSEFKRVGALIDSHVLDEVPDVAVHQHGLPSARAKTVCSGRARSPVVRHPRHGISWGRILQYRRLCNRPRPDRGRQSRYAGAWWRPGLGNEGRAPNSRVPQLCVAGKGGLDVAFPDASAECGHCIRAARGLVHPAKRAVKAVLIADLEVAAEIARVHTHGTRLGVIVIIQREATIRLVRRRKEREDLGRGGVEPVVGMMFPGKGVRASWPLTVWVAAGSKIWYWPMRSLSGRFQSTARASPRNCP